MLVAGAAKSLRGFVAQPRHPRAKNISTQHVSETLSTLSKYQPPTDQFFVENETSTELDPNEWKRKPNHFWTNTNNHRAYFDWLESRLRITDKKMWYPITAATIHEHGGGGLLTYRYRNSPRQALLAVYPEHQWEQWKFTKAPRGWWKDTANHKVFLDAVAKNLNLSSMEDWYSVQFSDIQEQGGSRLLVEFYSGLLRHALTAVYPHHQWLEWKFAQVPKSFWHEPANRERYANWLQKELGYETMEDWYRVTADDIERHRGSGMFTKQYNGSRYQMLVSVFPDHAWDERKFKVPAGMWNPS